MFSGRGRRVSLWKYEIIFTGFVFIHCWDASSATSVNYFSALSTDGSLISGKLHR